MIHIQFEPVKITDQLGTQDHGKEAVFGAENDNNDVDKYVEKHEIYNYDNHEIIDHILNHNEREIEIKIED